jgi:hypothetical protein
MLRGMPGLGGGLGECAVCGKPFTVELLMGTKIPAIHLEGFSGDLCIHKKCMDHLERARDDGWESLPEGPIRKAFSKAWETQQETTDREVSDKDASDAEARLK